MRNGEVAERPDKGQVSQLERAFQAIDALVNTLQPMKLTALAEVTELDASGTLRLLKTLIDLGYVRRDDARKSYLPTAKALFPLGLSHPLQELRRDAAELLFTIQRDTSATSALQVFLGGRRVVLEQRHGASRLSPFWHPTVTSPYHSSASGKLLLSTLTTAERAAALGLGPFERFTPQTLTTLAEVEADIRDSLARGFFAVREEALPGMCSIAASLRVPNGEIIGCMIAYGTTAQMPPATLTEHGLLLKRAADMLSTMSPAIRALEHLLGRSGSFPSALRQSNGDAKTVELLVNDEVSRTGSKDRRATRATKRAR